MPRYVQANNNAPSITSYPVRTRGNSRATRALQTFEDEEDTQLCPLCCEELDETEKRHYPCPCGYQVCLFCLQRLQQEYGNRCPGCRTVYGTDREEWERQAEARAKALQVQCHPSSPKSRPTTPPRQSNTTPRSPAVVGVEASKSYNSVERNDTEAPSTEPGPSRVQTGNDTTDESDWPSLNQLHHRTQAVQSQNGTGPTPTGIDHRGASSQSALQSVASEPMPKQPPGLPLPVTVQSMVNGTSTSLDTVIDLHPEAKELHTYFARDLSPLIDRLKLLRSNDKSSKKSTSNFKNSSSNVHQFSAAKRRTGAAPCSASVPLVPPGLECRTSSVSRPAHPAQPKAWPQLRNDQQTNNSTLLAPGSPAPPIDAGGTTNPPSEAGASTARNNMLSPPPGLNPPPGLGGKGTRPAPASLDAGTSSLKDQSFGLSAAPGPSSNILHELFPRENTNRLGWFASPVAFEGNMHHLWNSSAPLSSLVHPTRSATRSRRPLYARKPEGRVQAVAQEESGPPPGLDRGSTQDPVVATLSRKLGGRAAEIGANVQ